MWLVNFCTMKVVKENKQMSLFVKIWIQSKWKQISLSVKNLGLGFHLLRGWKFKHQSQHQKIKHQLQHQIIYKHVERVEKSRPQRLKSKLQDSSNPFNKIKWSKLGWTKKLTTPSCLLEWEKIGIRSLKKKKEINTDNKEK